MRKRNQKGLATVEIVLFVIIFALIGFIGWYVMDQNKKSEDSSNKTIATSENTTTKTESKPSGVKFVFKEMGVQFDLPKDLTGLTYKAEQIIETNGEKTTGLYLTLATDDIKSLLKKCYGADEPVDVGLNFGAVSRLEGQYKEPNPDEGPTDGLLKQFDGFYVLVGYPNGITSCSEKNVKESLIQDKAHALSTSFKNAFEKTATKIQ